MTDKITINCYNLLVLLQFITVTQAILSAGKQLQQLTIGEEDKDVVRPKILRSNLLKKLILTASSASVIGNAAKMLSSLNKDSAAQGDLTNLIMVSDGQYPQVCALHKEFVPKLCFLLGFML